MAPNIVNHIALEQLDVAQQERRQSRAAAATALRSRGVEATAVRLNTCRRSRFEPVPEPLLPQLPRSKARLLGSRYPAPPVPVVFAFGRSPIQ